MSVFEDDDVLELQAQQMAETALANLPEAARAAKLAAVKEGILKRLKTQSSKGAPPPTHPATPAAAPPAVAPIPSRTTYVSAAPIPVTPSGRPLRRPPSGNSLEKVGSAEACGDEPWFADSALRRRLLEKTAAAHSEQKILVGAPAEEIKRICPDGERVLGAGAVLRLGGAHHGGFGEADVKYAYRQLSRALHPDKNPGIPEAPDAFKRLSDASEELKRGIQDAQRMLHKISHAVGSTVSPDMLERPQMALIAESSRLLSAVLALTGEGTVPATVRLRASSFVAACSIYSGCKAEQLRAEWYDSDELLDMFATMPLRIAYDSAPKRFRAQFLSLLNRAAAAEAAKNDSCVRGPWQAVLGQFPEISILREFLDRLRRRCLLGDGAEADQPDELASTAKWATSWRTIIASVLPDPEDGAVPLTDRELRLLGSALWEEAADWAASKEPGVGDEAARALELFIGDQNGRAALGSTPAREIPWAFVPASDLLLCVGEGIVGITAEGMFLGSGGPHETLSFRAALRKEKYGSAKRGLAAPPMGERKVKETKLNRGPSRIVLLTNMVGAGEVDDDLQEETAEEAEKYGTLKKCFIREQPGAPDNEAVRIFLEFDAVEAASKAYKDMNGRYFDGRTVKARFYDEARFERGDLDRKNPTKVLLLTNLVSREDMDGELEKETLLEAEQFGKVARCVAREVPGAPDDEAVRMFIEYQRTEDATKALSELNGRTFGGREVKVRYFEEDAFRRGDLLPEQRTAV